MKENIENIRKSFDVEGYTLLSSIYEGCNKPLSFVCPNGHKHIISWTTWKRGVRCGHCCTNNKKVKYDDIKISFETEGYQLISEKYTGIHSKLEFICPNGHKHSISWNGWKRGSRCGRCWGNIEVTYENVKKSFELDGYQLISEKYISAQVKLNFICPNGHNHNISWNNWQRGKRCGICSQKLTTSKGEKDLYEYIKTITDYVVEENNRSILLNEYTGKYLELDVYIPDIKRAIEYNGIYYHNKKNNDILKNRLCEEMGIVLLTITDKEWYEDPEIRDKVKSFIVGGNN